MVGKGGDNSSGGAVVGFRNRIKRTAGRNGNSRVPPNPRLTVDAAAAEAEHDARQTKKSSTSTPRTQPSTPSPTGNKTPAGIRGRGDLRSPGVQKTPGATPKSFAAPEAAAAEDNDDDVPIPDFITQTDKDGRATTPRSADAIQSARKMHPSGPEPHIHIENGKPVSDIDGSTVKVGEAKEKVEAEELEVDACDSILDSLRMMCCCLLPEDPAQASTSAAEVDGASAQVAVTHTAPEGEDTTGYSTRGINAPMLQVGDSAVGKEDDPNRVRLLPEHHPDDLGKKCLVLDLDETLVHSSFRAVPGADFVIPVQIEDVVHFVYVMKRPGVDEFLNEMAKHFEVVVYTASLNKYADPLLDLLDPNKTIRTRLFRESCVYYEGNYVKDLSLLDRDLSQAVIVDNSPSSYIFHPENAIDCTSFIDDPNDVELDQIGAFLKGIKDAPDVRGLATMWRDWPDVDLSRDYASEFDQR